MFKYIIIGTFIGFVFCAFVTGVASMARTYIDDREPDDKDDDTPDKNHAALETEKLNRIASDIIRRLEADGKIKRGETATDILEIAFASPMNLPEFNGHVNFRNVRRLPFFWKSDIDVESGEITRRFQRDEFMECMSSGNAQARNVIRRMKARNIIFEYLTDFRSPEEE